MLPKAWWADEMLGRLARYLRMVGLDTVYVVGLSDDEVSRQSRAQGRTLLTRDRALAARVDRAVLLTQVGVADQWRELRTHFPELPSAPTFTRCTLCNGAVRPWGNDPAGGAPNQVPEAVLRSGATVYRCSACSHLYWEGSHTESVRRRLRAWSGEGAA